MQKAIEAKAKSKNYGENSRIDLQNNSSSIVEEVLEILFLRNDEDNSVEIFEGSFINFGDVVEHLNRGHSVFITPKVCPANQQDQKRQPANQCKFIDHL